AAKSKVDLIVPMGIVGIVLMMVLPLPAFLLDGLLTLSVALSIGVFLTALYIETALEFSAFPAFVLVATLLRLSLNVATTRLILLHGAEGHGAAGQMVEAFGRFVVGGNIVVGLAVFLILVVINFVVITKGAGRVAEVAARFTLDAMPGKQMAIDADLSSGLIGPDQARDRRKSLEREADFFGAMDGASKFVHGDAVAGLLITAINLIGGLVLGLAGGMDLAAAAETFSILSVGDALLAQIPALLVSAASGIVVTRSATGEQLGRAFVSQLAGRKASVAITAGIMTILGLLPGMPTIPCLGLGVALFMLARKLPSSSETKTADGAAAAPGAAPAEPKKGSREDIDTQLGLETLTLELGYELVPMVDASLGGTLLDRVVALRQEIARECGIVVPPVHVCDSMDLPPATYRVLLLGNEIGRGECRAGRVLAIESDGAAPPIDGEPTKDPAFQQAARWIATRDREMAEALGYTVVDHPSMVATHLGEMLRANSSKLVGRQEAQHLLEVLAKAAPKLVDEVVPNLLPLGDVVRVLRNLLGERVSVRDMRTIMEALADAAPQTKDTEQLTELARERLAAHISSRFLGADRSIAAIALDPRVEDVLRRLLRDIAAGTGAIDPALIRQLTDAADRALPKFNVLAASPVLVTPPELRRFVRAIFERKLPQLNVLSFREIDPAVSLRIVETIGSPAPAIAQQIQPRPA
ncbi:MAG: flagellar biosynthesis protein FlhA, partial [Polyangiaceae bacterium]|nr:flagellar biosynthesis protein FlhA [Polyangiaceae bacterium]